MPPLEPEEDLSSRRLPLELEEMREEQEESERHYTRVSRPSRRSRINITMDAPELSENNEFADVGVTSRVVDPLPLEGDD